MSGALGAFFPGNVCGDVGSSSVESSAFCEIVSAVQFVAVDAFRVNVWKVECPCAYEPAVVSCAFHVVYPALCAWCGEFVETGCGGVPYGAFSGFCGQSVIGVDVCL